MPYTRRDTGDVWINYYNDPPAWNTDSAPAESLIQQLDWCVSFVAPFPRINCRRQVIPQVHEDKASY